MRTRTATAFALGALGLIWIASPALAAPVTTYYDHQGMPRCLVYEGKQVFLTWDNDPYSREIRAYPLASLKVRRGLFWVEAPQNCGSWRSLETQQVRGRFTYATAKHRTLFGIPLGERIRRSLNQLSFGGNLYRSFDSGNEYIALTGLRNYNIGTNRALTRAYGVRFAAEVYRAWVERDPANARFRAGILSRIRAKANGTFNQASRQVVDTARSNVRFILVDGWGSRDPKQRVTVEVMAADLRSMGFDALSVFTEPYGDIVDNARPVAEAITEGLNQGKSIILAAASRGVAEGLTAIADLNSKGRLDRSPGTLIGFLNFSGLVGGSFVADWIESNPGANGLATVSGAFSDNALSSAAGLNRREVGRLNARNFRNLPKYLPIFNFVGIPPGNGLVNVKKTRMLQDLVIRKYMSGYGANDALVEYPETEIPRGAVSRNVTFILDGSHILFDGTLDGAPILPRKRREFFSALLETLFEDGYLTPRAK